MADQVIRHNETMHETRAPAGTRPGAGQGSRPGR